MNPRRGLLTVGLCIILSVVIAVFLLLNIDRDEILFHGIPESKWIQELEYSDSEQVDLWRGLGPEGVAVLIRGWEKVQRPRSKLYRKTYRNLSGLVPDRVLKVLPTPKQDTTRSTRMRIISLLSSLSMDAMEALPVMIHALSDEDMSVRTLAVTYFTAGEGNNVLLNQLKTVQSERILKKFLFLRAGTSRNSIPLRNNLMLAFRYFPEEKEKVIPVLLEGLKDSDMHVRMVALISLVKLDTRQAILNGAVPVAIDLLHHSDDQIAYRIARLMVDLRSASLQVVPALLIAAKSDSGLLANSAIRSLGHFSDRSFDIIPVLRQLQVTKGKAASPKFLEETIQILESGKPMQ